MNTSSSSLITTLRNIVGVQYVLCHTTHSDAELIHYESDWRQRYRGRALAIVCPISSAEVAAIVQCCALHRITMVPQGGNTGLVLGSIPDDSETQVVINLNRMNRILSIDAINTTITVQAGCLLSQVHDAAEAIGMVFPLSMASEGSCTIGGNLATNAGGTAVLRYGNMRHLCLGLEVVTPTGNIWSKLKGLRKDNTGYDMTQWFIGAEGTLGIITAATLKLYPRPAMKTTAWIGLPSLEAVIQCFTLVQQQLGPSLTAFELINDQALQIVEKHFPQLHVPQLSTDSKEGAKFCYNILLESSDYHSNSYLEQCLETLMSAMSDQGIDIDIALAAHLSQVQTMWSIREHIPLAQALEGLNIKHDISLPISKISLFVAEAQEKLQSLISGVRIINFGHVGDGNLHFNVQAPDGIAPSTFLHDEETKINNLVYRLVLYHGGSIAAEHGIGSLKTKWLQESESLTGLSLMRMVKHTLDPHGLMNSGRILE